MKLNNMVFVVLMSTSLLKRRVSQHILFSIESVRVPNWEPIFYFVVSEDHRKHQWASKNSEWSNRAGMSNWQRLLIHLGYSIRVRCISTIIYMNLATLLKDKTVDYQIIDFPVVSWVRPNLLKTRKLFWRRYKHSVPIFLTGYLEEHNK